MQARNLRTRYLNRAMKTKENLSQERSKEGFLNNGDSGRGRKENTKDGLHRKNRMSSKTPETASYDGDPQTRSQTSVGLTQQQEVTPEKRSNTEETENGESQLKSP